MATWLAATKQLGVDSRVEPVSTVQTQPLDLLQRQVMTVDETLFVKVL